MMKRYSQMVALGCTLLLTAACGTAGVKYEDTTIVPANDAASASELIDAAGNRAIVINVPISRIMIQVTPKKPTTPGTNGSDTDGDTAGHSDQHHGERADADGAAASGSNDWQKSTILEQTIEKHGFIFKVAVIPTASDDMTLRVTPINDFFSKNDLGVTKIAGTDIPQSVSSQFTDLTQARITEVGSAIITGLKGIRTQPSIETKCSDQTPPDLATIDVSKLNLAAKITSLDPSIEGCWYYRFVVNGTSADDRLHFGDPGNTNNSNATTKPVSASPGQTDLVTREVFSRYIKNHSSSNSWSGAFTWLIGDQTADIWPVPACWEGSLEIFQENPDQKPAPASLAAYVIIPLTLIDPNFLRLVPIPDKGKIAMHPVCNADVTDSPVDKWATVFDALNALELQANAIKGTRLPAKQ